MKIKVSNETVRAFLTMITKKNWPSKVWVDKWTEIAGEFRKMRKAEGIQIYSTMSHTTAAFAEGTIRSLKNILHRDMDDYGYKYIHKLSQLVRTLTSRKKLPNRFDIKKCQDFRLSLQSVRQATTRIESPSRRLETEFASQTMTYPSGTVIRHTLLGKVLKLLRFLPENLQHTQ